MKPRNLVALLVLTLGLGGFIYFFEKDLPSTDERRRLEQKLLPLEADDVRALTLRTDDGEVRLERLEAAPDGEAGASPVVREWRLAAPFEAAADGTEVSSLVGQLVALEKGRDLQGIDRQDAGLSSPRVSVVVATADAEHTLEVGAEVPLSGDSVVAVDGQAFQVGFRPELLERLTWPPGEWRDRRLFTASRADVQRLTVETPAGQVLLGRRGEGERFWIEAPITDRADGEKVGSLLGAVSGLRAESFVDDGPAADLGLEPPRAAIEAVIEGEEQAFRLEIGGDVPGDLAAGARAYGRVDGQLVELDLEALAPLLELAAEDWRSRAWTSLQVFQVESARFEDAAGVVELAREGGDWRRGEDLVDYAAASDVLYPLAEARAERLVSREEAANLGHDLGQPSVSVTLASADGESEDLSLFPPVDGLHAATASGRQVVLLITPERVRELGDQLAALRAAEPLPAPAGEETE